MKPSHSPFRGSATLALIGSIHLAAGLLLLLFAGPPEQSGVCTGIVENTSEDPTAPAWYIRCVGSCTNNTPECKEGQRNVGSGLVEYFCPSCATGGEPGCCHAVADNARERHKRGVCAQPGNSCAPLPCNWVLSPDNDEGEETRWVAYCTGS